MTPEDEPIGEAGEEALIRIFAVGGGMPGPEVVVANGDDAAAFQADPGQAVVVTTDALVEGTHFDLAYTPAECVGRKLVAVNLSDLAAMGATPRYALLAVALARSVPVSTARAIARGVHAACRAYGVVLLGGNVAGIAGPMVLTATLFGAVAPEAIITRRGARPGDVLLVTGTLGDARAGLELVQAGGGGAPSSDDPSLPLFARLIDPTPRVEAGRTLARLGVARAMCDLSDGLGRDVGRLLEGTGFGADLEAGRLPVSAALRAFAARPGGSGRPAEAYALAGGEDYELLFAVAPADVGAVVQALAACHPPSPATVIGAVTARAGVEVLSPDGTRTGAPRGFDHFG